MWSEIRENAGPKKSALSHIGTALPLSNSRLDKSRTSTNKPASQIQARRPGLFGVAGVSMPDVWLCFVPSGISDRMISLAGGSPPRTRSAGKSGEVQMIQFRMIQNDTT